jgi:GAF domain-containing protein
MEQEPTRDAAEVRLNRLLNLILETAVEAIGFTAATVTAREGEGTSTVCATDQRLIALDEAQYEAGGPCVDALDRSEPTFLADAGACDHAWEHFGQTAQHLGITSSLSVHMPTDSADLAASLNLYAREPVELTDRQLELANTYASQLAATLQSVDAYKSAATLARHLAEAMRTRAVIEQAKGMLMAAERITAEEAFQRLCECSQRTNVKLREVARRLVEEHTTPQS